MRGEIEIEILMSNTLGELENPNPKALPYLGGIRARAKCQGIEPDGAVPSGTSK